jgi:hypothetical protein
MQLLIDLAFFRIMPFLLIYSYQGHIKFYKNLLLLPHDLRILLVRGTLTQQSIGIGGCSRLC